MATDNENNENLKSGLFNVPKYVFYISLFAYFLKTCTMTVDTANHYSNMTDNAKEQQFLEEMLHGQKKNSPPLELETEKTLADFLAEGLSPEDLNNYARPNRNGSLDKIRDMDPTSLLLAAKQARFSIKNREKDPKSRNPSPSGINKYLSEDFNEETGNEFDLRLASSKENLSYQRETSHIIPRGKLSYGSKSDEVVPDKMLEEIKGTKSLVLLDVSGSMCSEPNNYKLMTFNGKQYNVYLPSVLALAISDHYIHELDTEVAGFTFSENSYATPFERNMATLANHFSRLECSTTEIDYYLLEYVISKSSSYLDIYIITDNDILSEPEMRDNIRSLESVMGSNELQRVFFIEWRPHDQGYNRNKDNIIKQSNLPNAYYSKISNLKDIETLAQSLNEKITQDSK